MHLRIINDLCGKCQRCKWYHVGNMCLFCLGPLGDHPVGSDKYSTHFCADDFMKHKSHKNCHYGYVTLTLTCFFHYKYMLIMTGFIKQVLFPSGRNFLMMNTRTSLSFFKMFYFTVSIEFLSKYFKKFLFCNLKISNDHLEPFSYPYCEFV